MFTVRPAGYRLPDAMRLGMVRLQVADLARSIEYYERVVGLHVLQRKPNGAVLGVEGDGTALVELNELPNATPVPRHGRLGLYHFAILLPDRAALGRFAVHLSQIGEYAGMSDHLVSEALYLTDPDGLGIEMYADRPRSAWLRNGDALAMATDPLDVTDLARIAAGRPWRGVPGGTRIGHVHLFVSDLDIAASFYHDGIGLDRIKLEFSGALFMSAGGYHHHLGTNIWAAKAPRAIATDARLIEWTVILPAVKDVEDAAGAVEGAGFTVEREGNDALATDPWGTRVRITANEPAARGNA